MTRTVHLLRRTSGLLLVLALAAALLPALALSTAAPAGASNPATAGLVVGGAGYATLFNTGTNTRGSNITLGSSTQDVAMSPDGRTAFVATSGTTNNVVRIDMLTDRVARNFSIASGASQVEFSPAGDVVYVINANRITPIRVATNTVGTTIELRETFTTFNVADLDFSPDGTTAYAATGRGLFPITVATGAVGSVIATPWAVSQVEMSPNGTTAVISGGAGWNFSVGTINVRTKVMGPQNSFRQNGNGAGGQLALNASGTRAFLTIGGAYAMPVLNVPSMSLVRAPSVGSYPRDVVLAPSGTIYVAESSSGSVYRFDADGNSLGTPTTGFVNPLAMAFGSGAPTATFTATPGTPPTTSSPVAFDATASVATFGTISSYEWAFGDGTTQTTSTPTTTKLYTSAGSKTVTLTVRSSNGAFATATRSFALTAGPALTSLSPSSGTAAGGTTVTILGTNFTGASAVRFGTTAATSYTVNSATRITAVAPPGTAGPTNVTVTTPAGTTAVVPAGVYTYTAPVTVTSVSPGFGAPAGGNSVVITGTGFTGATVVRFDTTAATFTVNSNTQITATAPTGAVGTVEVRVTTPAGTSAPVTASRYRYDGTPTVTSISPARGVPAGGTNVIIRGTNFNSSGAASAVRFGTNAATSYTVYNDTTIVATSPARTAGTVNVTVTTPGGTSANATANQFVYAASVGATTGMVINFGQSSISPIDAATNTLGTPIAIGRTVRTVAMSPDGSIAYVGTPEGVVPVNPATRAVGTLIPVSLSVAWIVFSPDSKVAYAGGSNGVSVTPIDVPTGTARGALTFGSATTNGVAFSPDSTTAYVAGYNNSTAIPVTVATGAKGSPFSIGGSPEAFAISPDGTTLWTADFNGGRVYPTTIATRTVGASIAVGASGPISLDFTLDGASLLVGRSDGTVARISTASRSITTTVTLPGGDRPSTFAVGPDGTRMYVGVNSPNLTSINLATNTATRHSTSAGNKSELSFASFQPIARMVAAPASPPVNTSPVTLDASASSSLGGTISSYEWTFGDGQTATTTTPTTTHTYAVGGTYTATVRVVGANGGFATTSDTFQVYGLPTVTDVAPDRGVLAGGNSITLTGTGFNTVNQVRIGDNPPTAYTVNSPTSMTVTVPPGTAGTVNVNVTNPGGTSVTSPDNEYTYLAPPEVAELVPDTGPSAGGTSVVIAGDHLTGATGVSFGGTPATSFTVDSDDQITAVAPAHAAGDVNVVVTSPAGTSTVTPGSEYSYVVIPMITSLTPDAGPLEGTNTVTIAGTGFTGATSVDIGTLPATSFTVDSDTQITAMVPAAPAGAVDVQITTPGGTSAIVPVGEYTYADVPEVSAIAPAVGPIAGGTSVTVAGTGFSLTSAVDFGGVPATSFTVDSDTQITAVAPAAQVGAAAIAVTTPGGVSPAVPESVFTYVALPVVERLSPIGGDPAGGTTVRIIGTDLDAATSVSFGSLPATSFTVDSDTQITAVSPAAPAGNVQVTVTNLAGTSATSPASLYRYTTGPVVASITPDLGRESGGYDVVIGGSGFTVATAVDFGGVPATSIVVDSPTQLTVGVPAGSPGPVDVTVTTPIGTSEVSLDSVFTYVVPPTITSVSPDAGPTAGGNVVAVTGTDFVGVDTVEFGGPVSPDVTVISDTLLLAEVPAGAAGTVTVRVVALGQVNLVGSDDDYTYVDAPEISALAPDVGPTNGGTAVTVTGTGFTDADNVFFGDNAVTSFTVDSDTQITAVSPAGDIGAVDVIVSTVGGPSVAVPESVFTYDSSTTVTAISPVVGPTAGGTVVTITGHTLTDATDVDFGTTPAASFTVDSDTQITAVAPAHAAGDLDLTVTTPDGGVSAASSASVFTYADQPTITSLSPNAGPLAGGNSVTITGTGFTDISVVEFGPLPATSFTVDSPTQITAVAPARAAAAVDVTVVNPAGRSANSAGNTYTYTSLPVVAAVAPAAGPDTGGTAVTLTGSGFSPAVAVNFGGDPAASFTVDSATQITATAPAHAIGPVDVTVVTPGGTSALAPASVFTYVAVPTLAGVAPDEGPETGGTTVVLSGSGLLGTSDVSFGGLPASSFTVDSATQITAVTPAGVGVADVTLTTPGGTTPTGGPQFTYVVAPTLTSIAPTAGPLAGGNSVVLTGTGFTGATAVAFGPNPAAFTVDSDTQITATAPAHAAGPVDVSVTTVGGTTAPASVSYTYTAAPTVTALAPSAGPVTGGTTVVVTGSGFTGASDVLFDGAPVSFAVDSDTQITAVSPVHAAGDVDVTVVTGGGTSATSPASLYSYVPVPTLGSVAPDQGPEAGGATVVLTGSGLSGATAVEFGGVAATSFTVDSDTQITAVTPAHVAAVVAVTVSTAGGTTSTAGPSYEYVVAPVVTTISPSAGPLAGGTVVTLSGSGFTTATAIDFGSTAATSFVVDSDTQITAVAPVGSTGSVDVVVTSPGGSSAPGATFTYTAAPVVSSVVPAAGPLSGGTSLTISGSGFTAATSVDFGSTAATSFTVDSDTRITATSPAAVAGVVDVVVTGPGGTSVASGGSQYAYVAAPTLAALAPALGPDSGGTFVTITGTGFTGASVVKFGTANATSFTVDSDTQITAVSPGAAAGPVDVTVTTPGGTTSITSANAYSYVAAPTVTELDPEWGTTAGGTAVTITGTGFTGASGVKFDGTDATSFVVDSATQITAVSPVGVAGAVPVTVTVPGGGASAVVPAAYFTYVEQPVLTGLAPATGSVAGGETVTLTGTGFTVVSAVLFGTTPATSVFCASPTSCTVTTPAGAAGEVDVTVVNPMGTSVVGSASRFTYLAVPPSTTIPPVTTTVPPTTVPDTTTTIPPTTTTVPSTTTPPVATVPGDGGSTGSTPSTGSGPRSGSGSGSRSATTTTTTTVPVTTTSLPTAAGVGRGLWGDNGTWTAAGVPVATAVPSVARFAPAGGPGVGGNTITLTGTNFDSSTIVHFGDVQASGVRVMSPTRLTVTVVPGATATELTATNSVGQSVATGFNWYGRPSVTDVERDGDTVTITGSGFYTPISVRLDGRTTALTTDVVSPTKVVVTIDRNTRATELIVSSLGGTAEATRLPR